MRVLLVDDEVQTLRTITSFLERSDAEVLPVTDYAEAARHITHEHFDGMIIDVHMSSPDSVELTRTARQTSPNRSAPIVLITGFDDFEIRRRGLEVGATFFAAKPITSEKIQSILQVLQGFVTSGQRRRAGSPSLPK
jgi:CheY-like chemotaxis protein